MQCKVWQKGAENSTKFNWFLQWDDENPLVREYGLWAVRNLCEGNEAIQDSINSLRACSPVDSPELQAKGLQIELDSKTGKPRLVASKKT